MSKVKYQLYAEVYCSNCDFTHAKATVRIENEEPTAKEVEAVFNRPTLKSALLGSCYMCGEVNLSKFNHPGIDSDEDDDIKETNQP